MSVRMLSVGVAALVCAAPALAQERGAVEFGAFASAASFDDALSLSSAYGGGGRIGIYLDPRWVIEFEKGEMRASRPSGLANVNVGILASRLAFVPARMGAMSLIVGLGAGVSTETNFLHSYGVDAMLGAKLALGENAALRVDGVFDWLANEDWKAYQTVRVGLSMYRRPARVAAATVASGTAVATVAVRQDSVSAAETGRLRGRDAALRALRDSLNGAASTTSAAWPAAMQGEIHFGFDRFDLSDSAKALLDEKMVLFRANPGITVIMAGYTDVTGTDAYNMALGTRRAQAAKDYIVAGGIAASRVIIESRGERQQLANSAGAEGEAPNRRAVFRLLIAADGIER